MAFPAPASSLGHSPLHRAGWGQKLPCLGFLSVWREGEHAPMDGWVMPVHWPPTAQVIPPCLPGLACTAGLLPVYPWGLGCRIGDNSSRVGLFSTLPHPRGAASVGSFSVTEAPRMRYEECLPAQFSLLRVAPGERSWIWDNEFRFSSEPFRKGPYCVIHEPRSRGGRPFLGSAHLAEQLSRGPELWTIRRSQRNRFQLRVLQPHPPHRPQPQATGG